MANPFSSIRRIVFLIVVGPATAVAVAVSMQATDYRYYTPEPGEVRTVFEAGWPR